MSYNRPEKDEYYLVLRELVRNLQYLGQSIPDKLFLSKEIYDKIAFCGEYEDRRFLYCKDGTVTFIWGEAAIELKGELK